MLSAADFWNWTQENILIIGKEPDVPIEIEDRKIHWWKPNLSKKILGDYFIEVFLNRKSKSKFPPKFKKINILKYEQMIVIGLKLVS